MSHGHPNTFSSARVTLSVPFLSSISQLLNNGDGCSDVSDNIDEDDDYVMHLHSKKQKRHFGGGSYPTPDASPKPSNR